jgi:hypothetical protein
LARFPLEDLLGLGVAVHHETLDLAVDLDGRRLAVVLMLRDLAPEKICSSFLPKVSGPRFSDIPHSQTMRRATSVAFSMSLPAPVVRCSRKSSSATRRPSPP